MEAVTIQPCTVADVEQAPNLAELLAEYGDESAIDGLGAPCPQFGTYRLMESAGMLFILGAFHGNSLVGFIILIVSPLPHFGTVAASTESFFVTRSARKSGVGLRMLREAEQLSRSVGAAGLLVSTPAGGKLEQVMRGFDGYRVTNTVFFRSFA